MIKKPTSNSTKAEILAAYKELAKEKASLESQIRQLNQAPKPPVAPKPKSSEPMSEIKPEHPGMKDTIDLLMKLQIGFGSAVSDLSEKLTLEATQLEELRSQVDAEISQLTELHSLSDVDDQTLETLLQEYQGSYTQFEQELAQRQELLTHELLANQKAWQKEKEDTLNQLRERQENYSKTTQREAEEYRYDLELQRQLDALQQTQTQEEQHRQLEERQQQQQKAWEEREKAIADQERQLAEGQKKVDAHPQELEAAVKRGKESGRNIAYYQAKVKADLKQKEVEGQKQFYELRIKALETSIHDRENRIQSLNQQLESALKQVQDLAVKAIESAANANSLQAVKDIALEQAKTSQRAK